MPLHIRSVWCADTSAAYEPIDFLALLIGYAISGERTLADFFERVAPFETAFMACLGAKSSSSLQLESLSGRCGSSLFRSLSHALRAAAALPRDGPRKPLAASSIDRGVATSSLMSMPHARQHGNERSPAIRHLPAARRRLDAVCAPGYTGRKRGEVVRTRTTALQMHTRQWIGTYAGRGQWRLSR